MDDYEKYEEECRKIRTFNKGLLKEFEVVLRSSGLSKKVIQDHVSNIDFYINDYLMYEEALEAKTGVGKVSMFLGYCFIKKAMWASKESIKSYGASLKKFYAYMNEKGLVENKDLTELKETIKEEMSEWLETLKRYDNPSNEDVW